MSNPDLPEDTRRPVDPEQVDALTPDEVAAHRDAQIIRLRRTGATFEQIGAELGFSKQYAHRRYTELLKEIPGHEVAEYRREQEDRLDWLLREARAVLGRDHVLVSHGRVVREGEPEIDEETGEAVIREGAGSPMLDDAPKLAAIKAILDIESRRAKLLGLDAPVKTDLNVNADVQYTVVGVDTDTMK